MVAIEVRDDSIGGHAARRVIVMLADGLDELVGMADALRPASTIHPNTPSPATSAGVLSPFERAVRLRVGARRSVPRHRSTSRRVRAPLRPRPLQTRGT